MTTPCGTTERSIRSTAGMCGQECAKPGCVSSSAWTRPSRCSSRGAMCACGAASRRCTEWRRPKRRRQSPHVRPASPKKRALGWRTSLSGLAHLCTRLSRYPMLVGEHRCPRPKTKGAPGKSGPAIFALKISEDRCSRASPKQICPQNQNPQNGHLMARFDWGLGAVCFGANPVAAVFESASGSATPPEHRIHFKPTSQEALLKQDISTLLGIGHFYFALTNEPLLLDTGTSWLYSGSTEDLRRFNFIGYKSAGKVYASDPDVAQNGVGSTLRRTRRAPDVSLVRVHSWFELQPRPQQSRPRTIQSKQSRRGSGEVSHVQISSRRISSLSAAGIVARGQRPKRHGPNLGSRSGSCRCPYTRRHSPVNPRSLATSTEIFHRVERLVHFCRPDTGHV